jgi:hypothetical protein
VCAPRRDEQCAEQRRRAYRDGVTGQDCADAHGDPPARVVPAWLGEFRQRNADMASHLHNHVTLDITCTAVDHRRRIVVRGPVAARARARARNSTWLGNTRRDRRRRVRGRAVSATADRTHRYVVVCSHRDTDVVSAAHMKALLHEGHRCAAPGRNVRSGVGGVLASHSVSGRSRAMSCTT